MRTYKVSVVAVGGAGSATGTAQTAIPVEGYIAGIYVAYNTQPITTDVTIATKSAPVRTILTLTDANTDRWAYPQVFAQTTVGVDSTTYQRIPVADHIQVTVAQGNAGTIDVWILVEDES